MRLVITTLLSPLLSKKLHGNTLRHTWDTGILLKTANFKHFEHFPDIQKFKKSNFAVNHCEYVWDWSQLPDFHHCWAKNCMGIPWGIPELQGFSLKQLKTTYFKHFEHFSIIEIFQKTNLLQPLWICVRLFTTTWFSPLLSKKLHGNTLRHTWDTVILLKTA